MASIVVGGWATVRGRYRTSEDRRVEFVDRIHTRDGRIAALPANPRADQLRIIALEQRPR